LERAAATKAIKAMIDTVGATAEAAPKNSYLVLIPPAVIQELPAISTHVQPVVHAVSVQPTQTCALAPLMAYLLPEKQLPVLKPDGPLLGVVQLASEYVVKVMTPEAAISVVYLKPLTQTLSAVPLPAVPVPVQSAVVYAVTTAVPAVKAARVEPSGVRTQVSYGYTTVTVGVPVQSRVVYKV